MVMLFMVEVLLVAMVQGAIPNCGIIDGDVYGSQSSGCGGGGGGGGGGGSGKGKWRQQKVTAGR